MKIAKFANIHRQVKQNNRNNLSKKDVRAIANILTSEANGVRAIADRTKEEQELFQAWAA